LTKPVQRHRPNCRNAGVRLWDRRYAVLYLGLALAFSVTIAHSYDRHTGFTSAEIFGERFRGRRLPQLHDVPIYTYRGDGYDGQFYAQLAVAGNPLAPELRAALDSPAYRSRRILLPVLAHLAGLGRPIWVLNAFALSNLLCWWILAWVLATWWFPPDGLHNLLRWVGTLFGAGMIVSVTHSLTDGPALLFIALGVRCVERHRTWLGAGVLALAGLVRETSIICAAAFALPVPRDKGRWLRVGAATAVIVLPAAFWIGLLYAHYHLGGGGRNLALPFLGLRGKIGELIADVKANRFNASICGEMMVVIALTIQVVFIVSNPTPGIIWWRIGCVFAIFWSLLGFPVWESTPSAASRAVLPLTLAFNVLVPRSARGLAVLIAGNLTVLSAPALLTIVRSEQTSLTENISVRYGPGWYGEEHLDRHTWRWARGTATIILHNPNVRPFSVTFDFGLRSLTGRTVTVSTSELRKAVILDSGGVIRSNYGAVVLPPGDVVVTFVSKEPAAATPGDARQLAFALVDLYGEVAP
jgi:hypothetical protein